MRHFTIKLMVAITILGFASCSPVYYGPNTQNVPLLSHAGEYNIGVSGNSQVLEFQGSVSPINHLGLQLNGTWYITEKSDSGDRGAGYFTDAGIGFYQAFGPNDILVFETYVIGGIGGVRNTFSQRYDGNTYGSIYSNMSRYGLQPAFGVKWKYMDAIVSARFVGLSYFNTSGNLVYNNQSQRNYLDMNRHAFLIEPAFTLRAGPDFLKAQLQLGGSFNMSNSNFYQRTSLLTIGLVLSPNRYRNVFAKR